MTTGMKIAIGIGAWYLLTNKSEAPKSSPSGAKAPDPVAKSNGYNEYGGTSYGDLAGGLGKRAGDALSDLMGW